MRSLSSQRPSGSLCPWRKNRSVCKIKSRACRGKHLWKFTDGTTAFRSSGEGRVNVGCWPVSSEPLPVPLSPGGGLGARSSPPPALLTRQPLRILSTAEALAVGGMMSLPFSLSAFSLYCGIATCGTLCWVSCDGGVIQMWLLFSRTVFEAFRSPGKAKAFFLGLLFQCFHAIAFLAFRNERLLIVAMVGQTLSSPD